MRPWVDRLLGLDWPDDGALDGGDDAADADADADANAAAEAVDESSSPDSCDPVRADVGGCGGVNASGCGRGGLLGPSCSGAQGEPACSEGPLVDAWREGGSAAVGLVPGDGPDGGGDSRSCGECGCGREDELVLTLPSYVAESEPEGVTRS